MQPDSTKKTSSDNKDAKYKENGDNFKAGKADSTPLPNNPAKNATLTSPEEDKKSKKRS